METVDPRGRTPLHLAVTLGHLESARILLRHGANANAENSRYWTGTVLDLLITILAFKQDNVNATLVEI